MDDIVEDARREVEVLLTAWQTQGTSNRGIFRPRVGGGETPKSDASSEYYNDLVDQSDGVMGQSGVRFAVSEAGERRYRDEDNDTVRNLRMDTVRSPETINSEYFSA